MFRPNVPAKCSGQIFQPIFPAKCSGQMFRPNFPANFAVVAVACCCCLLLLVVVCCLCVWGGGPGARGPQVLAGREATGLVHLNNGKDSDSKISHTRTATAAQHEGGVRDKQTDTRANRTDKHKHQAHNRQPLNQTQSSNLSRNKQRKTPLTSKQFNNPYTRLQNKQAKNRNMAGKWLQYN